jgi:transcriptional repressor NrdR
MAVARRKGEIAMRCPYCNKDNTRVVDSRPVEDTNSIRRRRICDICGKRFTTYEQIETIPLSVIKKDEKREQYNRRKIQDGVLRACYKRPIPREKIDELLDSVEGDIYAIEEKEIPSATIGEIVMNHLKELDAVAYVRFASVYREFKDVDTFMDELKKILN